MLDIIENLFGSTDLYTILNTTSEKAEDKKQLHSAYLRAALRFHPDKCTEDKSTEKFQLIQKIYDVLKDDDLRKAYNETGEWPEDEEFTIAEGAFGRLDENAILEFKKAFIGSDEEREDIKRLYVEGKGDIFHIVENLFFANILTDEERLQSIIDDLIEKGEVEKMTKGAVSQKRREKNLKKAQKEAKEAEEELSARGLDNSMGSLCQAIAKRNAQREEGFDNFLNNLEKKYGAAEPKAKKLKSGAAEKKKTKGKK